MTWNRHFNALPHPYFNITDILTYVTASTATDDSQSHKQWVTDALTNKQIWQLRSYYTTNKRKTIT